MKAQFFSQVCPNVFDVWWLEDMALYKPAKVNDISQYDNLDRRSTFFFFFFLRLMHFNLLANKLLVS